MGQAFSVGAWRRHQSTYFHRVFLRDAISGFGRKYYANIMQISTVQTFVASRILVSLTKPFPSEDVQKNFSKRNSNFLLSRSQSQLKSCVQLRRITRNVSTISSILSTAFNLLHSVFSRCCFFGGRWQRASVVFTFSRFSPNFSTLSYSFPLLTFINISSFFLSLRSETCRLNSLQIHFVASLQQRMFLPSNLSAALQSQNLKSAPRF